MKSVLIIGMGTLGRCLAQELQDKGNDVMIVDKNEDVIAELAPMFENSFVADCVNIPVMQTLGINNYDICFVAVGEDFYASIEITSILKELGAQRIVAKAKKARQEKILRMVGADDVFFPEAEIAEQLAVKYTGNNIIDYKELDGGIMVFELPVLHGWIGKAIKDINVRREYGISIIAVKAERRFDVIPEASYVFSPDDHLIIIGEEKNVLQLSAKLAEKD